MIAIPLNVERSQVGAEGPSISEQKVLNFDVVIHVSQLFRLRSHSTTKEVEILAALDDDWPIEPITQTK